MSDTLLLNHDGQPLCQLPPSVIDWQTAIKLVYLDRVTVVKNYADWHVRSPSLQLPVPSIIMTKRYVRPRHRVMFNRKMLYLRDNYTCQYCGVQFQAKELTLDHVKPKSLGGASSWSNMVTCCATCNWLKGAKVVEPINKPREPSYWQMLKTIRENRHYQYPDPAWADYLAGSSGQAAAA